MVEGSVKNDSSNPDKAWARMWDAFEARQGRKAQFAEIGDAVVMMSLPRMSLVNGQNLFCDGYVKIHPLANIANIPDLVASLLTRRVHINQMGAKCTPYLIGSHLGY